MQSPSVLRCLIEGLRLLLAGRGAAHQAAGRFVRDRKVLFDSESGFFGFGDRVERLQRQNGDWLVHGHSQGEAFSLSADWVINAAGLFAQALAEHTQGLDAALIPRLQPASGPISC